MSICTRSPYPPSTPAPERTLYMRPLPASHAALDSAVGRAAFQRALLAGTAEGYFKLAQQFHTQADPAYCGLGSLVCALNALGIDPGRRWKGSWRWFSEELLDCCKPLDEVRRSGISLDVAACLARCNGADAAVHRAGRAETDVALFREHVLAAASDQALVLDTARFKYPPHWMPVELLFAAMQERDADTGAARGWLMLTKRATR